MLRACILFCVLLVCTGQNCNYASKEICESSCKGFKWCDLCDKCVPKNDAVQRKKRVAKSKPKAGKKLKDEV